MLGLEDRLARALEDVQEARNREMGMMNLFREILGQFVQMERGESSL